MTKHNILVENGYYMSLFNFLKKNVFTILSIAPFLISCSDSPTDPSSNSENNPLSESISIMASELPSVMNLAVKKSNLYLINQSKKIKAYSVNNQTELGEIDEIIDTPLSLVVVFKVEEGTLQDIIDSGMTINGNKCFGLFILKSNNKALCTNHEISEVAWNSDGSIVYFSGQEYSGSIAGQDGVFKVTLPQNEDFINPTRIHTFTSGDYQGIEVNANGDLMVATNSNADLKIYEISGSTQNLSTGSSSQCFLAGIQGTNDQNHFYYAGATKMIKLSKSGTTFNSTDYTDSFTPFDCKNPSQIVRTPTGIFVVRSNLMSSSSHLVELLKGSTAPFVPTEHLNSASTMDKISYSGTFIFTMSGSRLHSFNRNSPGFTDIISSGYDLDALDTTSNGDLIFSGKRNSDNKNVVMILESGTSTPETLSDSSGNIRKIRKISL